MKAIGIDIGTTTICGIAVDVSSGQVLKTVTEKNDTNIESYRPFERLQNADLILEKVIKIVDGMIEEFSPVASIGLTGQMHGMLYLDEKGDAISPLYTWQDESANQPFKDGKTYAEYLTQKSGCSMSSGFGLSTLFVHLSEDRVPGGAAHISTVHDFVAMRLAGKNIPVTHPSDGASFGLFDLKNKRFDTDKLNILGINEKLLPQVADDSTVLGCYRDIPVCVAIGDNQASYIGSVMNMSDCLLVNIGTGSQVSLPACDYVASDIMEIRPCTDGVSIAVGSALCGGRAFAALEKFFKAVAEMVTGDKCDTAYPGMDALLVKCDEYKTDIACSTKFCGTRKDPSLRGEIKNIGLDNFTPKDFMLGVLGGIVDELYEMLNSLQNRVKIRHLIGSGNGLRQNKALQKIFEQRFGMSIMIPAHHEEAAFGAVLFSLAACEVLPSLEEAQKLIKYC